MKLNLGCGSYRASGWINVNIIPTPAADVVADITRPLPFASGSVDRVYCGHVLEHIAWPDVPVVLREVTRLLAPQGQLAVVGPDMDVALAVPFPDSTIDDIVGGQSTVPGYMHQWTATAGLTLHAVRRVFTLAMPAKLDSLVADGWPLVSTVEWQCGVIAFKGG